jgi:MFS family permease
MRAFIVRWLNDFFTLPPDLNLQPEVAHKFRHNILVNGADSVAWLLGDSFLSASTILPVFASKLLDSPLLIGLIPALLNAGWFLPQFFMAPYVSRLSRKLPTLAWLGVLERLPFVGLCLLALGIGRLQGPLPIIIFVGLIVWRAFASGLIALPWQELIATVIPPTHRGRYFGYSHLLGSLAGVIGAVIAARILAVLEYPGSYALVFLIGSLCVFVSYAFLMMTAEPHVAPPDHITSSGHLSLRQAATILRKNTNFRTFLLSRGLSYTGGMASGFLAVYGIEHFRLPDAQAAIFTAILLVGNMVGYAVAGWIGDRHGYKRVLAATGLLWLMALSVALAAPTAAIFYLVFALVGISNGGGVVADLNIAMEFSYTAERPMYMGLARTTVGPLLLIAPLVGGRIAQVAGYPLMFGVSLAFAVAGLALLWIGVTEPRHLIDRNLA